MKNIMEKKKHEWKFIISVDSIEFSGLVRPTIKDILENNPSFAHFKKYFNQDQTDKNDYEKGCIHTANAFMPVISELIFQLQTTTTTK